MIREKSSTVVLFRPIARFTAAEPSSEPLDRVILEPAAALAFVEGLPASPVGPDWSAVVPAVARSSAP